MAKPPGHHVTVAGAASACGLDGRKDNFRTSPDLAEQAADHHSRLRWRRNAERRRSKPWPRAPVAACDVPRSPCNHTSRAGCRFDNRRWPPHHSRIRQGRIWRVISRRRHFHQV